jgi:phage shock protein A
MRPSGDMDRQPYSCLFSTTGETMAELTAQEVFNIEELAHKNAERIHKESEEFVDRQKSLENQDRMIRVLEKIEHAIDGGKWNPGVRDSLENLEKIDQKLERISDALNRIASRMP